MEPKEDTDPTNPYLNTPGAVAARWNPAPPPVNSLAGDVRFDPRRAFQWPPGDRDQEFFQALEQLMIKYRAVKVDVAWCAHNWDDPLLKRDELPSGPYGFNHPNPK